MRRNLAGVRIGQERSEAAWHRFAKWVREKRPKVSNGLCAPNLSAPLWKVGQGREFTCTKCGAAKNLGNFRRFPCAARPKGKPGCEGGAKPAKTDITRQKWVVAIHGQAAWKKHVAAVRAYSKRNEYGRTAARLSFQRDRQKRLAEGRPSKYLERKAAGCPRQAAWIKKALENRKLKKRAARAAAL